MGMKLGGKCAGGGWGFEALMLDAHTMRAACTINQLCRSVNGGVLPTKQLQLLWWWEL